MNLDQSGNLSHPFGYIYPKKYHSHMYPQLTAVGSVVF
jgi:hypothetical protein